MDPSSFDLSDESAALFCPSCASGFRSGPDRCPDCNVDLLSRSEIESRIAGHETWPEPVASSNTAAPIEQEVRLCEAPSAPAAEFIRTTLNGAGIRYLQSRSDSLTSAFGLHILQRTTFFVSRQDKERARAIVEDAMAEDWHPRAARAVPGSDATPRAPSSPASADEIRCPKCDNEFLETEVDSVPVASCTACGGLWLFEREMKELISKSEVDRFEQESAELPEIVAGKPTQLGCPICEDKLESVKIEETEIELCPRCRGIYLDLGELEEVAGPISPMSGGHEVIVNTLGVVAGALGLLSLFGAGEITFD